MQQKQRVGDLEEEIELLRKQLSTTQTKVIEQVIDFVSKDNIHSMEFFVVTRDRKFKSYQRCLQCSDRHVYR